MEVSSFQMIEQLYGISATVIHICIFAVLLMIFIPREKMSMKVRSLLCALVFAGIMIDIPLLAGVKGVHVAINLLTIIIFTFVLNRKMLPVMFFLFFLWKNIYCVFFLLTNGVSDFLSKLFMGNLEYETVNIIDAVSMRLEYWTLTMIALQIVIISLELFALWKVVRHRYDMTWTEAMFLSSFSVLSMILTYLIIDLTVVPLKDEVFILMDEVKGAHYKLPLFAIVIFVGEMLAIATWQQFRTIKKEALEYQGIIRQTGYMKNEIESAKSYYEDMRMLRHDMAGKLTALKGFIEGGRIEDASDYLEKMNVEFENADQSFHTGDPISDIIISAAARKAGNKNILFDCELILGKVSSDFSYDVGIILKNLLDNAISGADRVTDRKKYITLKGYRKNNVFIIMTANPYTGEIVFDKETGLPISEKNRSNETTEKGADGAGNFTDIHGIGLSSIKRVADRHLGTMSIKTDGGIFKVKVMIQME
ncbi:sensor histidine kinase [Butyrivibrio sp. WCE2006]|uniref:sensor histidine kinase n=1 Tax=Butyrivibrio sp. WCE2006 TaxID=1410611 RepID=UPI0005D1D77A|nr:GHKL domain-containing protein [Butyrivibrio sp. WCE2006]